MVRMPEDQRLQTLEVLKSKHTVAMQALSSFPLIVETESRKRRKNELEQQVKQLEGMISALSHQVVYVKP